MESVVYVGMDVHKDSIAISMVRDENREADYVCTIKHERKHIHQFFKRLKEKEAVVLTCYEAGPTGFALYRQLEELNISCTVVAPSLIPRRPGDRIKTDHRDSLMLAKAFRNQDLTAVHVPQQSDEATRDFLRMCDDQRTDLKRHKQRLLQFLLRLGYKYEGNYWTASHRKWLKLLHFDQPVHRLVFDQYYTAICESEEHIERLNEEIEHIADCNRYHEPVSQLRCFKGIETFTALSLVTEVGDFRRFPSAQKFMAYLGLVPSEHSSGEKRMIGSITKAGNSRLRKLLIESSWHYKYYKPSKRLAIRRRGQPVQIVAYADKAGKRLNRKYTTMIHRGKPSQKTTTAIARELAGFVWGMMVGNIALDR